MGATILLVEDEDALVLYLQSELKFEGYTVLLAEDGQAAWQMWQDQRATIDCVLLDWMLPKLDGLEVLRRIRKTSAVPVMMMTARDYIGDKVAGLDNGADDYLTKPFEIEELLARLRVLIRRNQKTHYQVGDLTLDTESRRVTRDGVQTALTQREFDLLLLLMQHANTPLSRDDMLDAVWGTEYDGGDNVVDVYIRYLRQKIDHAPLPPMIQTVRGVGYMLQAPHE